MKFFKIFFTLSLSISLVTSVIVSCKKADPVDPCANIVCSNNGSCFDGTCQCTQGYTGTYCQTQLRPSAMIIKTITITKFPTTTSAGSSWDIPASLPDIYPEIHLGSSYLWVSSKYVSNATGSSTFDCNYRITDLSQTYGFGVWDFDGGTSIDPDDHMGGLSTVLYSVTGGFPKTITLQCATCAVALTLNVSYEW